MRIELRSVTHSLPADFAELHAEAGADGHVMLDRLAEDWANGIARFNQPGEQLVAAYVGDALAGIGGLTFEPAIPGAMRMRRFYVAHAFRRIGVARALALRLLEDATAAFITANAAAGSEVFWEALGFRYDRRDGYSHILVRDRRPGSLPPGAARSG